MGVHRITSEAAKYYAARERVLGNGISLLGVASEKASELDKKLLEEIGDLAAALLPHSPGYAGKLMAVVARLFWALAGVKEKEFKFVELEDLEKWIEELRKKIEG
ncbi:conserved hypothetical protein [Ferroglobus placidus DSM 10642]|uniref:Uncharacterized protein n=1 Tax=Ferroglobus placidus (strain DSM 10642 / AEDII12DO) TaxID=589924 RepID=D3RZ96_FERPA|nr:hypothetical protein [Ferroglobus placidus]ADC65809.1 conserved hypothetical protein [Ferroglobus placidus DSM 10642]